ncbi:MAG: acireductone dioxygenase, partial [Cyanobacteria bacterium K_DeepCast_35m_m1_288]|nr:acireductone dioxygenase [Cyanobacteria bacterium K_DeepCast_35m_m1_288]
MTLLALYDHTAHAEARQAATQPLPALLTSDAELIASELEQRGLGFARWPARAQLSAAASQEEILAAYASEIARVQQDGGYATVDAIRLSPD